MANAKKRKTRKRKKKNNNLTSFEKIQFLQFEYDWQKQRRSDLVYKAQLFLCWNAAVFAFAIVFTDIEKIINVIRTCQTCKIVSIAIVLVFFLVISLVLLGVSTFGFFDCLNIKPIMCFQTEEYIDGGFDTNKIITDYKTIIISYDDFIKGMVEKLEHSIVVMIIGISVLLCVEFILRILVCF